MIISLRYNLLAISILAAVRCHSDGDTLNIQADDDTMNLLYQGRVKQFDYVSWSHVQLHPQTTRLNKRSVLDNDISAVPDAQDSFLLQLDTYNKTFCFHMHPNYDLIHADARVHRQSSMGLKSHERLEAKAYRGYVMSVLDHSDTTDEFAAEDYSCDWTLEKQAYENYGDTLGWARFVVRHDEYERSQPLHKRNAWSDHGKQAIKFEGSFVYDNDMYTVTNIQRYISTRRDSDAEVPHVDERLSHHQSSELLVYRKSDIKAPKKDLSKRDLDSRHFCGHDQLEWNTSPDQGAAAYFAAKKKGLSYSRNLNFGYKDTSLVGKYIDLKKRVVSGCPQSKRVLYMGVVMDCTYIAAHGSAAEAQTQVISNWNTASQIYEETFNVYLGLLKIVQMPTCGDQTFNAACSSGYLIGTRLSDFSQWRGTTQDATAGLWHLMSNCASGATIGIAWLNMLCQTSSFDQTNSDGTKSYVSGCGVSTVVTNEFMVVAHEIGHNFGASHDCTASLCVGCTTNPCSQCCPCQDKCDCQSQFIMNPTNDASFKNPAFSQCTQTDVCGKNQLFGTCLETPGTRTALNGGICGNGLKEGTEQCDCGGAALCATDSCCFQNCTLKAGAVCSDSNDGCCDSCHIVSATANKVCRPSEGECDVPEICGGTADCPVDQFKPDGLACGNYTDTKCATGSCTSRAAQCLAYGQSDVTGDCTSFSGQCSLFCNTPFSGCIKVSGNYRNGTPCGTGYCYGGTCTNPDTLGAFLQWIYGHQNIAIVLFVVGGIILLVLVGKCLQKPKVEKRADLVNQIHFEEGEVKRIKEIEAQRQKKRQMEKEAQEKRAAQDGGKIVKMSNKNGSEHRQHHSDEKRQSSHSDSPRAPASASSSTHGAGRTRSGSVNLPRPRTGSNEAGQKPAKQQLGKSYDPRSPISEADEDDQF